MNKNILVLTGDITGGGKIEAVFYNLGNGLWYIGEQTASKTMNLRLLCEDSRISNLTAENSKIWSGNFTGRGRLEILIYHALDNTWLIGRYVNSQLKLDLVNNNSGFSNILGQDTLTWTGDFTGSGKMELLIHFSEVGDWYIGVFEEEKLSFKFAGSTNGYGSLLKGKSKIWVGNFTNQAVKEILLYSIDEGKCFLGKFEGFRLIWSVALDTNALIPLRGKKVKVFPGSFSGKGVTELMFYCRDNGIWYIGAFEDNKLNWRIYSLTYSLRKEEEYEFIQTIKCLLDQIVKSDQDIIEAVIKYFNFKDETEAIFNLMVFYTGFNVDKSQKIFYARQEEWEKNPGYFVLYDETSKLPKMNLQCEPVIFYYDNRWWRIEFWKGQYSICTGAEIGIYTGEYKELIDNGRMDHTINRFFGLKGINCAGFEDMLEISFVLKKNKKVLFTRNSDNKNIRQTGKYWWQAGFKPGEVSSPSELIMENRIIFKDETMCNTFVDALVKLGYSNENDIYVSDLAVYFAFEKPLTE